MEMGMQGMTVMKMVYDGKTGYQTQMGQKKEMDAEMAANYSDNKGIFEQQFYNTDGYKLSTPTVEKVNGEDAYKITVTKPSGKTSTEYYSVNTGLLVRMESKMEAAGQEMEQTMDFGNYTTVAGVKVPGTMSQSVMGQSFEMTMSNYKVNEGVTDEDFK
ncbi:hypothetical protein [Niabella ginsengisoli]|uniref:DUF4412 domain-containing protein n=1 Tax=Niabella ginsengisoli TaxID=522298 RepID=A0ABS9SML6_9BACT|nr:hypothetical protein [Niabella ginsengisoli]MCH5599612.1 hypothetical protein [Niabella ginsengisoli]